MSTVTPEGLLEVLQGCRDVLLTGPVEPDGDSVGACLGLQWLLARRGVRAEVAGEPGYRYGWMPGASDMISDARLRTDYDAVVVMDGDRHRLLPNAAAAFTNARVKAIVDHHASTTPDGYTHCWIEPHATSTCEMVYDALVAAGETVDADIATRLYVGSIFDTGGFRYSNTTPATHRMAAALLETGIDHAAIAAKVLMERRAASVRVAGHVYREAEFLLQGQLLVGAISTTLDRELGLVPGDLEGVVDALVYVHGVEVAALLIERADESVKVSLRSRGRVNVAEVAKALSTAGGGHAKAAGASVAADLPTTRARLADIVHAVLSA